MRTTSIVSVGAAAPLVGAMPSRIEAVAEQLRIAPALRINGVPHYDESDLERIAEAIRRGDRSRSASS
ncbi:MAG: hypothetical protein DCC67_11490 [Planctomycetota bacterium]|nr:MAG: hypothetical protein DCC67_11490 [Planctomycetota bacterium]